MTYKFYTNKPTCKATLVSGEECFGVTFHNDVWFPIDEEHLKLLHEACRSTNLNVITAPIDAGALMQEMIDNAKKAKEKEMIRRKEAAAKKAQRDIEKKRKQLEQLQRELGVSNE
jgi:hypothetical protein